MIDLHTHSLLSDGVLLPSELVRRAFMKGYKVVAITDHVDVSNFDFVIPRILKAASVLSNDYIRVIPGVELTHIPVSDIDLLVKEIREMGNLLVIAHGETLAEPVEVGTNNAAIVAKVDILAHPGLISEEDALLAEEQGVFLEVSARKGHSLANGHVVRMSKKTGVKLVLNTDAHIPSDLINKDQACRILYGAGLERVEGVFSNSQLMVDMFFERGK